IIAKFITDTIELWQAVPVSEEEEVEAMNTALGLIRSAQARFADVRDDDLSAQEEQILDAIATMLQNSPFYRVQVVGNAQQEPNNGYNNGADYSFPTLVGFAGGIGQALFDSAKTDFPKLAGVGAEVSRGATYIGLAITVCNWGIDGNCVDEMVEDLWELWAELNEFEFPDFCPPGLQFIDNSDGAGSGAPSLIAGMGGVPIFGGTGCGVVLSGGGLNARSADALSRIVIKIYRGTQVFPISGVVDEGGYFYLPFIPADEPFTALAIDTESGATRTQRGTGPAADGLTFLWFDFDTEQPDATLTFGQTMTGTIAAGETGVYAVQGQSGQSLMLRLIATSGELRPRIEVFRPDGSVLCQAGVLTFPLVQETCMFDANGYHVISISDITDANSGDYALFVQRADAPVGAETIDYAQTANGATGDGVALAAFRFDGAAGDVVLMRLVRTTETLNPGLYVHRPDGTQRCDDFGALQLLEGRCTLDTGGTHTIFVGDSLGQGSGAFNLFVQRINAPAGASALSLGVPQSGAVDPAFELDAYTFAATNGQQLTIAVTRTDGDLNPEWRVYRPDHTQLCQASAVIGDTASKNCNIDADGEHVILVGDFLGDDTGSYDVSVSETTTE
ncbi:MAG: hypothetical protein KDD84_05770, partial [Caldilineaceae bacterium]|nr:hypothetical protein [Caldilineaceae bacterium]